VIEVKFQLPDSVISRVLSPARTTRPASIRQAPQQ